MNSPRQSNADSKKPTSKFTILFLTIFYAVIAGVFGRELVRALFSNPGKYSESQQLTARSVAGLSMLTPSELTKYEITLTPQQRKISAKMVKSMEIYKSSVTGFDLTVSHNVYKPDYEADIDGAIKGSIDQVSAAPGVITVEHSSANMVISEKPAKRVSVNVIRKTGKRQQIESLFISHASDLWNIQCMFDQSDQPASMAAKRILDSVRFVEKNSNLPPRANEESTAP